MQTTEARRHQRNADLKASEDAFFNRRHVDTASRFYLHAGDHTAVDVQRDADLRMTETIAHDLRMDGLPQVLGSLAVAQLMKANGWQFGSPNEVSES